MPRIEQVVRGLGFQVDVQIVEKFKPIKDLLESQNILFWMDNSMMMGCPSFTPIIEILGLALV